MKRTPIAMILLAMTPLLLVALPSQADAQAPDPSDIGRRATPETGPRKAPPKTKKRAAPARRTAAPARRTAPPRRATPKATAAPVKRAAPPRRAQTPKKSEKPKKPKKSEKPKKPKKPKTHVARFYLGADLSFFPGASTSREIHGIGEETMPNTVAIRQVHGSSLRFIQGLRIMNGAMDVRFGVGLSNLIPVGGRRALWGSDFGLGAGIRIHRFGRFELLVFNAYRLLVTSGLDKDHTGIGLHLELGVGGAYRIDKRHWVELRLGYCRQQLRYREDTTAQVGGLETPSGVIFKTHMIMVSFAFLHFR